MKPFERIFEDLQDAGRLPTPSGVGMRILKLTQDKDCSMQEVGQVIMADSALTGRLLKLANAAQAGALQPVATVSEAIIRLGTRTVRNVSLGFSLISANRSGACEAFDYERYWSRSIGRAVSGQKLSRMSGVGIPAELYVVGLLSEIGLLALATAYPKQFSKLIEKHGLEDREKLANAELARFEIDHRALGRRLLSSWGLEESFASALQQYEKRVPQTWRGSDGLADMVEILAAADLLADIFVSGPETPPAVWAAHARHAGILRQRMGLEHEVFVETCDKFAREYREWRELLNISAPDPIQFVELPNQARRSAERQKGDASEAEGVVPEERPELTERSEEGARIVQDAPKGMRVLAVDDDPMSLRLLERTLERAGHHVTVAKDGEQALKLVLEQSPQIVVADWVMPNMDGLELCRTLRKIELGQKIYFLLLTGHKDEGRVVEAFESGVDDYVSKPFNPRVFLARIKGGQRIVALQEQVEREKATQRDQVAKLQIMARRLRSAALTDVLTGLPNRRFAMKRLGQAWESSVRTGNPIAIVMLDIDHFKRVNDEYGHDVGDAVLREISVAARGVLREEEDICRMGGEEFLIICPGSDLQDAGACAERIRATIERTIIQLGSFTGSITASLGVSQRRPEMVSVDDLLKVADEAVYTAKNLGRNRVCLAPGAEPHAKSA